MLNGNEEIEMTVSGLKELNGEELISGARELACSESEIEGDNFVKEGGR